MTSITIGDRVQILRVSSAAFNAHINKIVEVKGFSKKGWVQVEVLGDDDSVVKLTLNPDWVKAAELGDSAASTVELVAKDAEIDDTTEVEIEEDEPEVVSDDEEPDLLPPISGDNSENNAASEKTKNSSYFDFTVSSGQFAAALGRVMRCIQQLPTHPILSTTHMRVSGAAIELSGFDLRTGIITACSVLQVRQVGVFCLPARILFDLLSSFPEEEVSLTMTQATYPSFTLTSSVGVYSLTGMPADEFPEMPLPSDKAYCLEVPAKELSIGLASTLYATSKDEAKMVLVGVHFALNNDVLELASTDGHRLARYRLQLPGTTENTTDEFTIPYFALQEVSKFIPKAGENVVIKYDAVFKGNLGFTIVQFTLGSTIVISRVIEGQYPLYNQLIPKKFSHEAWVDREALIRAIKRLAIVTSAKGYMVKMNFRTKDKQIILESKETETASGRETVKAEISGDDARLVFNIKYLLDALSVIGTAEVSIKFNASLTPVILEPLNGYTLIAMIMPIQIRE